MRVIHWVTHFHTHLLCSLVLTQDNKELHPSCCGSPQDHISRLFDILFEDWLGLAVPPVLLWTWNNKIKAQTAQQMRDQIQCEGLRTGVLLVKAVCTVEEDWEEAAAGGTTDWQTNRRGGFFKAPLSALCSATLPHPKYAGWITVGAQIFLTTSEKALGPT
jgi:hypothetical protein